MLWLQMLMLELAERRRGDDGEVTIEYGILVVFVALALIAGATALSGQIDGWFGRIGSWISGLAGGPAAGGGG